jgi:hypothetical protein
MTEDFITLPTALLPLAKTHMRVDFTDDDADITDKLAQAIGYAQYFWELQVFGATVAFTPDGGACCYQCPVRPVSAFTAADAVGDVTAEYQLRSTSLTAPVFLERVDAAAFPAGVTFSLATGYSDPADMHPAMRGNILRVAATLYENRESISAISLDQVPFWLNDMMGGLWVPRA